MLGINSKQYWEKNNYAYNICFNGLVDWHVRPLFFSEEKFLPVWQQSALSCIITKRCAVMMRTDAKGWGVFCFIFSFSLVIIAFFHRKAQALCGVWSWLCVLVCFLLSPKSLISLLHLAATLLSLQHACMLGKAALIFFSLHADGSHILLSLDWRTAYICPLPASIPLMAQPQRLN